MQEGIASGAVRAFEALVPQDAVLSIGAPPPQHVEHALRVCGRDGILREKSCYPHMSSECVEARIGDFSSR
jgi:hypothetical protein